MGAGAAQWGRALTQPGTGLALKAPPCTARRCCFTSARGGLADSPPALPARCPFAPLQEGRGRANTALAAHAGRLLVLHEGDLPYALRIACNGLLDTIQRATFE